MRLKRVIERHLIKANLDGSFWIKEIDKNCMHVLLTRRTMAPGLDEPIFSEFVQTFTPEDWNHLLNLKETRNVDWMKSALVYKYRVIHDGTKTA